MTSEETVARADRFAEQIGKTAIHTKDRSGFIVNFLLVPYLMAAVRMYEEGFASREDIDEGMQRGCGHPMGPLTLCDLIGLDVLYSRLRLALRGVQARRVRAAAAAQADGRLRATWAARPAAASTSTRPTEPGHSQVIRSGNRGSPSSGTGDHSGA